MVEKKMYDEYHRYTQECSTSQNICIVNMFYKLDCVEPNFYFSHKHYLSYKSASAVNIFSSKKFLKLKTFQLKLSYHRYLLMMGICIIDSSSNIV